jgi:hypothetical protein
VVIKKSFEAGRSNIGESNFEMQACHYMSFEVEELAVAEEWQERN